MNSENDRAIRLKVEELSSVVRNATSFSDIELGEAIHDRMGDTLKQGEFWLKQGNPSRFLYDLEDLICWIKKLVESHKNKS